MGDVICWLNKDHALDFVHVITRNSPPGEAVQDMIVLDVDDADNLVLRWK
jgi:hypothetical protein